MAAYNNDNHHDDDGDGSGDADGLLASSLTLPLCLLQKVVLSSFSLSLSFLDLLYSAFIALFAQLI